MQAKHPEWIGGEEVKRYFPTFLVGQDGEVVRRHEPTVAAHRIRADLETLLDRR